MASAGYCSGAAGRSPAGSNIGSLVGPFRPADFGMHKTRDPHCSFDDYCALRRADGARVDSWLRALDRARLELLRVEAKAMVVETTAAEFPPSSTLLQPRAVAPRRRQARLRPAGRRACSGRAASRRPRRLGVRRDRHVVSRRRRRHGGVHREQRLGPNPRRLAPGAPGASRRRPSSHCALLRWPATSAASRRWRRTSPSGPVRRRVHAPARHQSPRSTVPDDSLATTKLRAAGEADEDEVTRTSAVIRTARWSSAPRRMMLRTDARNGTRPPAIRAGVLPTPSAPRR